VVMVLNFNGLSCFGKGMERSCRLKEGKRRRSRVGLVPWARRSRPESCVVRRCTTVAGDSVGLVWRWEKG
jgi:hypothetical protein